MANLTRAGRCLSAAVALLLLIGCAATTHRDDHDAPADARAVPAPTPDSDAVPPIEPAPPAAPVPEAAVVPQPVAPEPEPEPAPQAVPETESGPEPAPQAAPVAPDDSTVASTAGPADDPADDPAEDPTPEPTGDPTAGPIAVPEAAAAVRPPPPIAETVRVGGSVRLTGDRADVAETVLYFVPDQPSPPPAPGTFELATRDKAFIPTVLAVPRGSMIRFPNRDPILHNVFSVSSGNAFDLGVYGPGSVPDTTLDTVGAVNVYCNVHHDMHAHVLVLDTPWFERAGSDGRFMLSDLPPGPGTLHAWHRQADAWSVRIDAPADDSIEVVLEIVRPQLPAHLDKSGQSYQRRDRDPYR